MPIFSRKKGWWGNRFYLKFWSSWARWREIADFQWVFAHSASAVALASSINTNRKSTTRFPMSLRWTSHVAPKPPRGGGSKTRNGRFPSKIALCLKKVCYKVSLCENCQPQSCKAFVGLAIYLCKNDWWATSPSTWKYGLEKRRFSIYFCSCASAVTAIEESSINTTGKSTTRFPRSLRWTLYVALKMNSIRWS